MLYQHTNRCTYAAKHGNLELLKKYRKEGHRWNWMVCAFAAERGDIAMLQWARAQEPPCPWSSAVCIAAAQNGNMKMLQWARAQEPPCPWNWEVWMRAQINGDRKMLEWLMAHRCDFVYVYMDAKLRKIYKSAFRASLARMLHTDLADLVLKMCESGF